MIYTVPSLRRGRKSYSPGGTESHYQCCTCTPVAHLYTAVSTQDRAHIIQHTAEHMRSSYCSPFEAMTEEKATLMDKKSILIGRIWQVGGYNGPREENTSSLSVGLNISVAHTEQSDEANKRYNLEMGMKMRTRQEQHRGLGCVSKPIKQFASELGVHGLIVDLWARYSCHGESTEHRK